MTGQAVEWRRPERVRQHSLGLTNSLDYGKEVAGMNSSRKRGAPVRNTIDSFWEQVEVTPSCWLWRGAVTHEGYGYYWLESATRPAHRIAYDFLIGSVSSRLHLDHLCRVRNCVNPDHLEVVTAAENSRRANRPKVEALQCTHGHEWTPENTLPLGTSKRCRQCILVRTHQKRGLDCTYAQPCGMESHQNSGKRRSTCNRGHSMDDAQIRREGTRTCRECNRMRQRVAWKSAIPCPNEPSTFDRLLADIQEHDYPEGQSNAEV